MSARVEFGLDDGSTVATTIGRLVIAGYTGRDHDAVNRHIQELAEQGIAPPPRVPMFYELDPGLLRQGPDVEVAGDRTAGEVEPVYLRVAGHWYLGIGSDHTDRELEREDVGRSKAACVKPVGTRLVRLPDTVLTGGYDRQFDSVAVSSWVDDEPYQQGRLDTLRPPGDILPALFDAVGRDDSDLVVYGGTVPLLTGAFVFGRSWRLRLDTAEGSTLEHHYTLTRSTPGDSSPASAHAE